MRRSTAVAQQGSHETRSGNVGSDSIVKSAPRKVRKVSVLTLGAYSLSEAQWDTLKERLSPDVRRELQERVDSGMKGQTRADGQDPAAQSAAGTHGCLATQRQLDTCSP